MKTKAKITQVLVAFALLAPLAQAQVFHPGPPEGFDAVKASPKDRERYGFPPMPNKTNAKAYSHWLKLVSAPQTRVENPTAETTNYINYPVQNVIQTGGAGNTLYAESTNWSGIAVVDPSAPFLYDGSYIYSTVTVPFVNKENCAYGPFAVSEWVGFDGFSNADVLQAGIAVFGCPATAYVAWYEWFEDGCPFSTANQPCYETNVNLPVNPGDVIEEEVWYTGAAPNGHAYLLNETRHKSISVSFYQPIGTAVYGGSSAEWIVERPGIGNGLANLSNYWGAEMEDSYAYGFGGYYYPSEVVWGDIYNLTMVCPTWNPVVACKYLTPLSYVNLFSYDSLAFSAAGPATQQ